MATLTARAISVAFGRGQNSHLAVDGVSLSVDKGECLGIVGESGSGKTTVARVLVGLLTPTLGEVTLEDRCVVDRRGTHFRKVDRRRVQTVFQDPYDALNPQMRGIDAVVEAVRFWRRVPTRVARNASYDLLANVGISRAQADSYPRQLSGGQRQRISIARALAPDPDFLVADEPTSSIDQSAQAQLLNTFRDLVRHKGLAVVFISHDLSIVGYLSHRLLVMREGRVVEEGDTTDVLSHPSHPYSRSLLASIPGRAQLPGANPQPDGTEVISARPGLNELDR